MCLCVGEGVSQPKLHTFKTNFLEYVNLWMTDKLQIRTKAKQTTVEIKYLDSILCSNLNNSANFKWRNAKMCLLLYNMYSL